MMIITMMFGISESATENETLSLIKTELNSKEQCRTTGETILFINGRGITNKWRRHNRKYATLE